jgi:hypothetical protein
MRKSQNASHDESPTRSLPDLAHFEQTERCLGGCPQYYGCKVCRLLHEKSLIN